YRRGRGESESGLLDAHRRLPRNVTFPRACYSRARERARTPWPPRVWLCRCRSGVDSSLRRDYAFAPWSMTPPRVLARNHTSEGAHMIDRKLAAGVLAAAVSLVTAGLLYAAEEHHWSYQGSTGPSKWASLEHEYSTCGVGKTQSPIDIQDSAAKK